MKKLLLVCLVAAGLTLIVGSALANVTAPYSYQFGVTGTPWPSTQGSGAIIDGWTNRSGGNYASATTYYSAPSAVKFANSATEPNTRYDSLISPAIDYVDVMSVYLKCTGTNYLGDFRVYARQGANPYVEIRNCTWGLTGADITYNGPYNGFNLLSIPMANFGLRGATGVVFKFVYVHKISNGGTNVSLDDFSVTAYVPTGQESDAHIQAGGAGATTSISSLLVTEPQKQVVFSFQMQDAGTGTLNTIINSITVSPGSNNTASDWSQYIGGAKITDGTTTWTGTVATGGVTFNGSPALITLPNGGPWVTMTLSIWLKTTLPYNADNQILEFKVMPTSFAVDGSGSAFAPADAPVASGAGNNRVDIVATRLSITTQPPASAFVNTNFTVRAGFTDIYGGIDADFNEAITLALATGTGTLSAVSGLTKVSVSGQSAWTDARYNTVESGVILQAASATYPTLVLTNPITFAVPPTIVIDAYPTCWDKDTTNLAMPFAIHVSISNWLTEANHQVYVKTYSGSSNPYFYTPTFGWSNLANYDHKPIVTIDANGNWAGWLAIKSYGMGTFTPRAADVANTSTNLTGSAITGTLLDLSGTGNGAVLEDRDASTRSIPGDIILIRNASNVIMGDWIVEDNGYPLDDGGSPLPAGGWRMALCAFCEPATYETWTPDTWPGHGSPHYQSHEIDFCIYPGESVEVSDVILPVTLLGTPSATAGDGSVTLNWATASETGNARFDIARNGAVVGRVTGAGTSPTRHTYKWTENGLTNGMTYTYTLRAVNVDGSSAEVATINATPSFSAAVITEYALHQNFPNPFNPTTSIAIDLVDKGNVSLKVYNLMGQEVANLVSGSMDKGRHIVNFDASNLSSGIYLYRLSVNGFVAEKKMLLMK